MGNTLGAPDIKSIRKLDAFLAKYPNLLNKELLSDSKLFKTYSFLVESESSIIMKVYFKRNNASLKDHQATLSLMQREFNPNIYPHLIPYTSIIDDPEFVILLRPKIHQTLAERLWNLPMLTQIEKKWIIFQLITAVYNIHCLELYHGGISSNNTLLTTWNHVCLADFAWYTPNYIYEDKLGEVTYYYHSADKKCNLAPEKFIQKDYKDVKSLQWGQDNIKQTSKETLLNLKKMDIFSLGCVLAELMLDGVSLFTYQELLAYRRDQYSPQDKLDKIEDKKIQKLIMKMIEKVPSKRIDIRAALTLFIEEIGPSSFPKLIFYINSSLVSHNFVLPDQRIALIRELLGPIYEDIIGEPLIPHYQALPIPIQKSQILQHFYKYYPMIKPNFYGLLKIQKQSLFDIVQEGGGNNALQFFENLRRKRCDFTVQEEEKKVGEIEKKDLLPSKSKQPDDLILIVLMICSNIRHVRYLPSLSVALEMLENFSKFLSDHVKLHIIIPYLLSLIDELSPKVMIASFKTTCSILASMTKPVRDKSDGQLFENYILPNLLKLFQSQDLHAKSAFLESLHQIVEIATVFATEGIKIRYQMPNRQQQVEAKPQEEIQEIKEIKTSQEEDEEILLDNSQDTNERMAKEILVQVERIKLTLMEYVQIVAASHHQELQTVLLENCSKLAFTFGPDITQKYLMHYVISALNSGKNKILSLRELGNMIKLLPEDTVNGLLLLIFERCIFDYDEINVIQSLRNITRGVRSKKIKFKDFGQAIRSYLPLTIHPNRWIRDEVAEIFGLLLNDIDRTQFDLTVRPLFQQYLRNIPERSPMNIELFQLALVEPLPRQVYEDLKSERAIELVKDQQLRALALIFSEQFLDQLPSEFEPSIDLKATMMLRESSVPFIPKDYKSLSRILFDFYEQTDERKIKLLPILTTKTSLTRTILFGGDPNSLREDSPLFKNKILPQIIELRNQLTLRIPELLMRHGVLILNYVKNVQSFYLYSSSILDKAAQLTKEEKKLGSFERYERATHLDSTWQPKGLLVKTIYEHKDAVNCLDASLNGKFFASAGQDGALKVFDIGKIETDFTCGSICTISAEEKEGEEQTMRDIKAIKFLDDDCFVFGTNSGIIEVHKLQDISEKKGGPKGKKSEFAVRYKVDGEIKGLQPLVFGNNLKEKAFLYVTHKGELGIQSLNEQNPSLKYNIGRERGLITTVLMSAMDYTVVIGTSKGSILLYDIRANLVTSTYQLSTEASILSLANYYPITNESQSSQSALTAVSFASKHQEVGFWNLNNFRKNTLSPEIYMYSSPSPDTECLPSHLKDFTKFEPIYSLRNTWKEKIETNLSTPLEDSLASFLNYFTDERNPQYGLFGAASSKSSLKAIKKNNSVHKIICTPNFTPSQVRQPSPWYRDLHNVVFTAGDDMNIRFWDITKGQFNLMYNVDGKKRRCLMIEKDYLLLREGFDEHVKATSGDNLLFTQPGHRDRINDLLMLEKNEMIVTCSRDKTIKVWK